MRFPVEEQLPNLDRVSEKSRVAKSFLIELGVYAVLVVIYFLLVLEFLGGWLAELFKHERQLYAVVALALMLGQGVVLEMLTTFLLSFIRSRSED
jgi:NADH:ubiquinone oxidoreductase subunit H